MVEMELEMKSNSLQNEHNIQIENAVSNHTQAW